MKRLLLSAMLVFAALCTVNAQSTESSPNKTQEMGISVGGQLPQGDMSCEPYVHCTLQTKGLNLQPMVGFFASTSLQLDDNFVLDQITRIGYSRLSFGFEGVDTTFGQNHITVSSRMHALMAMEHLYISYRFCDRCRFGLGAGVGYEGIFGRTVVNNGGDAEKVKGNFDSYLLIQAGAKLRYNLTTSCFLELAVSYGWNLDCLSKTEPSVISAGDLGKCSLNPCYLSGVLSVGWTL